MSIRARWARRASGSGSRVSARVPHAQQKVWFVAEDSDSPSFPVHDATPAAAQAVIGECYAFEYYLIAKDLRWLLCENHHDTMMSDRSLRERLSMEPPGPRATP
jgi:hypothetical protein